MIIIELVADEKTLCFLSLLLLLLLLQTHLANIWERVSQTVTLQCASWKLLAQRILCFLSRKKGREGFKHPHTLITRKTKVYDESFGHLDKGEGGNGGKVGQVRVVKRSWTLKLNIQYCFQL